MMNRRQFGLLSASTMLLSPSISLIKPVLAVAQEEQTNPAEAEETAFRALQEEFSADRRIWIFAEPAGSKQRYRVVGDIVWLNQENFPSLYRADGQYVSDEIDLLIEARIIVVDMPLRLSNGKVSLHATTINFTFDGLISFLSLPGNQQQQIEMIARTISFRGARRYPLPMRSGVRNRVLSVAGEQVLARNGDRIWNARRFYQETALSLSAEDQYAGIVYLSDNARFETGQGGLEKYIENTRTARWPDAFALKLQRFFAADPYEPVRAEWVTRFAVSGLERFRERSAGTAIATLQKTLACAENGTDLYGLRKNQVPMSSLSERLAAFETQISDVFGSGGSRGLLELWDLIAVEASTAGGISEERVAELAGKLAQQNQQLSTIEGQVADADGELVQVEANVEARNAEIEARKTYLEQVQEAEANAGPNDGIAKGVQIIATVASVVFPAAAPFLMLASGIVSAVDAANRNEGDLLAKAADVQSVINHHRSLMATSAKIRESWTAVTDNHRYAVKNVTDNDKMTDKDKQALEKWKGGVSTLWSETKALYDTFSQQPESAELKIDEERIRRDKVMIDLVNSRNTLVHRQSSLTNKLIGLRSEHRRISEDALELEALVADLQKLRLVNDEDARRKRELSDMARRELTAGICKEASLLQRSLHYGGGRPMVMSAELLPYPEGDLDNLERKGLDDRAAVEAAFAKDRTEREASYRLLLRRARDEVTGLANRERWNIPTPLTFSARLAGNTGTPEAQLERTQFVVGLNRILADAIRFGGRSASIPIPFKPARIQSTENAVLFGINVSRLEFSTGREPDTGFTLHVDHPRYGEMYRDGVATDFHDYAGENVDTAVRPASFPIPLPDSGGVDWKENLSYDVQLSNLQRTMLPLLTDYRARITVPIPENWSAAPEISAIDIQFIAIRPA